MRKKFAAALAATIAATGIVAPAAYADAPAPAADQQCTTNIPVDDINNNIIPTVRAPQPNGAWMVNPDPAKSHFNSCDDLSFVQLVPQQQTDAQYDSVILMFHKGQYVGVDTTIPEQAFAFLNVTPQGFTARYKDYEALQAAGAPFADAEKYYKDVTFTWDGSKVVTSGDFPNQNLGK